MTKYKVTIEERGGGGEDQTLDIEANSEEEARQQATGQVNGVVKNIELADGSDDTDQDQDDESVQYGDTMRVDHPETEPLKQERAEGSSTVESGPRPDALQQGEQGAQVQKAEGAGPFDTTEGSSRGSGS